MITMLRSAYSKLISVYRRHRAASLIVLGLVFIAITTIVALIASSKGSAPVAAKPAFKPMPLSRSVLTVAEEQVRQNKPAPTEAAREYAYVSLAYNDGLAAGGQTGGLEAAGQMLALFYPQSQVYWQARLSNLAKNYGLSGYSPAKMSPDVKAVVTKYEARNDNDGHNLKWDGIIPTGPGKWAKKTAKDPFTPRAGEWQRWLVSQPITVPPPPVYGSTEYLHQLEVVKLASANRSGDDINKINYWGGTPGTNSPAGIWQDQLYKTTRGILPSDDLTADKKYSAVQSALAQTLSDAFMECWKVKYTYWTARPDMRDPTIKTAMPDPNFPGYISGHSTVSKAAADLLSVMAPQYAKSWEAMAVEARNSRLVAGIHFDIDNKVGFDVGTEVARQAINNKNFSQEL